MGAEHLDLSMLATTCQSDFAFKGAAPLFPYKKANNNSGNGIETAPTITMDDSRRRLTSFLKA